MYTCAVCVLLVLYSVFCLYPVLNELFNLKHTLTTEECSEVVKPRMDDERRDKLVLILSVKTEDAVKEATKVMKSYDFNTQLLHGELQCKYVSIWLINSLKHYLSHNCH